MRFGEKASEYATHAFVQRDLVEWGSQWLPDLLTGKDVLELGAGPGLLTRELLARRGNVWATDLAPAMVKTGSIQWPQAHWQVMDAWQAQGAYDFIASSALMQWAPDPVAVLMRQAQALRSGGRMFHLLFIDPTLCEFRQLAPQWNPFTWRTQEQWEQACDQAGLELCRSESVSHRIIFSSARELLRFFQRTGAVGGKRARPGELRRFLRVYAERFAEAEGVVSTWSFLCLEARKP
ncbi:class I SAM-dependent methyltransferase [Ruficoccus sp. ZRK36]|uniref:class I SAM-dependent methyltransferase n=1 Tax=Ruficoccus sp. ZRK36 TaxID=2866311 RepID=UPI001C73048C|nr:class I SAM-dependent methyltransferase [Ruficoccus sp. ZRK36]QYY34676.1 class I SAM-dependent methyltransferase [Ruficoccus sp. ZRK36]